MKINSEIAFKIVPTFNSILYLFQAHHCTLKFQHPDDSLIFEKDSFYLSVIPIQKTRETW